MPHDSLYAPASAAPQLPKATRTMLAVFVLIAVAFGLYKSLDESYRLSRAKAVLPLACMADLIALDPATAATRGVALGDCARKNVTSNITMQPKGRLVYGPADAPIDGLVVQVTQGVAGGKRNDMLFHVGFRGSRIYLNDVFAVGEGCNFGIDSAQVEGNSLGYTLNMTPENIILFGDARNNKRYAPGTLAKGSKDCFGKLVFADRRPLMLQLTPNATAQSASGKQVCFETLVKRYFQQGKTALNFPQDFVAFQNDYYEACH